MTFPVATCQLETSPCGRWYFCLAPIHWRRPGPAQAIVVPRGFASDGASVPRAFWRLFPPLGRYTPAAILHDWIYRSQVVSRADGDAIFRDACTELGVPAWQAWTLWAAVRAGGWASYGRRSGYGCDSGAGDCRNWIHCSHRQAQIRLVVVRHAR